MALEPGIKIRKATPGDINIISAIEHQRFPNPWKKEYFSNEISHDISYFYVAEDTLTGRVAGYIIFWIIGDMAELHKIAVSADYNKKGIGKALFLFMQDMAHQKKVVEIFLEVRKSNSEAIKFYEAFQGKLVGVRKNYYSDPKEDALIYRIDSIDSLIKK